MLYRLYLHKLNFRRVINLFLLRTSYWLSYLLKKPCVWAAPVSCSIEPLNYCNLQCPECFAGNGSLTRPQKRLDVLSFRKIINQISPNTAFLTLYFQGEPLLHPDFAELVRIADEKNIFTSTSTNGHFLADRNKIREIVKSGLQHLIVSVDGTTQETYEKYRKNGNLQQVLDGIRNITEIKQELRSKTPFVEIQFLVMRHNEQQIPEIKRIARDLQTDKLTLKSVQIYNVNKNNLLPADKKYNRYRQNADGTFHIKRRLRNRCWRQWSSTVITCNGDIVPCCFDKNARYTFGNVFDKPLKEIWHGKKANEFRHAILANRKNIDICCNCSET